MECTPSFSRIFAIAACSIVQSCDCPRRCPEDGAMSARLQFALWVSALQTLTFLAVWITYALMFRAGIARRFQAAEGQAPPADLARASVREALITNLGFSGACYVAIYPAWTAMGGRMAGEW